MKDKKWLFFDLGSTLIDETEAYRQRVLETISGSGVSYDEFCSVMMSYYKQGKKGDILAAEQYGFSLPKWKSECEVLFPDAVNSLERLHDRYSLGIIGNQPPGTILRLHAFGIYEYFNVIVASAEEGIAKPDPQIFLLALRRAQCSPEQAVMIGDRLDNDISPANRLGMTTVRVMRGLWRFALPDCLEEQPDYTVNSLTQLCDSLL